MFRVIVLAVFSLFLYNSCGIYKLSGASTGDAKSAEIPYFQNRALNVQPSLSRELTEKLKDRIQSQTNLKLVNEGGDTKFEGEILRYEVTPAAITGDNLAAKNRLTIEIKVKFTNSTDGQYDYETSFSRFEDFDSNASLDAVENDLIDKISDALVEDVFNRAFVNW
jgi:hypothetical protein